MTTFDQREEAFERRYAHDEDLAFKAQARRDTKIGRWAAALLGKAGAEADAYVDTILVLDVRSGDANAVASKVMADFASAGVGRSEHQVRRQMDEFLAEARHEVMTT